MADDAYRAIYEVVRRIPRGRVAAYGEVATRAGLPRRARLVGRALRLSTEELPWHRVLTASGRLAFPPDSPLFAEQARRLQAEGVTCRNGRVDLRRYGWERSLDELLWGPP